MKKISDHLKSITNKIFEEYYNGNHFNPKVIKYVNDHKKEYEAWKSKKGR